MSTSDCPAAPRASRSSCVGRAMGIRVSGGRLGAGVAGPGVAERGPSGTPPLQIGDALLRRRRDSQADRRGAMPISRRIGQSGWVGGHGGGADAARQ